MFYCSADNLMEIIDFVTDIFVNRGILNGTYFQHKGNMSATYEYVIIDMMQFIQ